MRNGIFLIGLILLLGVAAAKGSGVLPGISTKPTGHGMKVEIDSINCRKDLSRVYCRAIGRPQTSQRIDSVKIQVGRQVLKADDIDPIYFEQSFQWEEDGVMPLEIDFPAISKRPGAFSLTFFTPYGTVSSRHGK